MTRVCLLGEEDVTLRHELQSRQTAREALRTYDLATPFENAVGLETVSLGAAISLLNDLNWYIVRLVADTFVLEPSVSETEWLSRELAAAIRADDIRPAETDRLLKVYGIEQSTDGPPRLLEPMFLVRSDGEYPNYDLHDVEDTLVIRVTEAEFEAG
ncbi:MAG: DUF5804 family protein [Salinirussus sp.]